MINYNRLEQICQEESLEVFAVIPVEHAQLELQRQLPYLTKWQESGFAADMEYMKRDAQLFASLSNFLPDVRTVIIFSAPYYGGPIPDRPEGHGRVARYAFGRDYHKVLKRRIKAIARRLQQETSSAFSWRGFTDAVPLLERPLAASGNLGFIGRHSLVIHPHRGSFSFLAELLVNIHIEEAAERVLPGLKTGSYDPGIPGDGCGSCNNCLPSCPTGAIESSGVVNANRCISYLTIERKLGFTNEEASLLGEWLFGCDVCQEVCPFNHSTERNVLDEFLPVNGSGPFLSLEKIFLIKERADFVSHFSGTPLMRAGRTGLVRNACAVCANIKWHEGAGLLKGLLEGDDSKEVRSYAYQALTRLFESSEGLDRLRIEKAINSTTEFA